MKDEKLGFEIKKDNGLILLTALGGSMTFKSLKDVKELRFFLDKFFTRLHFKQILKIHNRNKGKKYFELKKDKTNQEEFI